MSCRKITDGVFLIVNKKMKEDDKTAAVQLQKLLTEKGYQLSLHTILYSPMKLGRTYRGNAYCKLIRDVNKAKRLERARKYLKI